MNQNYLNQFGVIDIEATGLDVYNDEIIELACARYDNSNWAINSSLFNSIRPIPYHVSAINNISRKMVSEKPTLSESVPEVLSILDLRNVDFIVSHNVGYDYEMLKNNFKRIEQDHLLGKFVEKENWICTIRLLKRILPEVSEIENFSFKLQYLRYALDLHPGENGEGGHRAGLDTLLCAHLLELLIQNAVIKKLIDPDRNIGEQLAKICWQPMEVKHWPIQGKYFKYKLEDIPSDYYSWALEKIREFRETDPDYDVDLTTSVCNVLNKRLG